METDTEHNKIEVVLKPVDNTVGFTTIMGQEETMEHSERKAECSSKCSGCPKSVVAYFKRKTEGLTRRQFSIFVVFVFVEFFAATVISIQAPFYPNVVRNSFKFK